MASPPREIRVFLSSTFKDMEHEREYLMSQVFPLIRQRCYEREVVFTEIDLRWGITEDAAQNGRTVQICLEEIDRCRALQLPPFFVGFLGERYGWVPTPQDVAHYWDAHTRSAYAQPIREALGRGMGVTELEIHFGFLDPPAPTAPGRVLMLLRDRALTAWFAHGERALAPEETVPRASFGTRLRRLLGTSQKLVAAECGESGPPENPVYDQPERRDQLARLKEAVREAHRDGKTALVDGYGSVEVFGCAVRDFLLAQLDALFPPELTPNADAQMATAHRAYAASRLRSYVPSPGLTDEILAWTYGPADTPLALVRGASGAGKSAFLADLARELGARGDRWVFTHFCGVGGDRSLDLWCTRVLGALRAAGGPADEVPVLEAERWKALPYWLAETLRVGGRPVVLVIDAVNQLRDAASAFYQLQCVRWPPGVRVIASCTPDVEVSAAWHTVPMPPLDEAARGRFVAAFLGGFGKSMADPLMRTLVAAQACENRLFLKLVLEECRVHASHGTLPQRVDELLRHPDSGALFLACLDALDRDFANNAAHLATHAARLLAASRRGLTHHDLAELLSSAGRGRIPDAVLLPLLANLQPYTEAHEGRLRLMHATFAEALQGHRPDVSAIRRELMAYFCGGEPWAVVEYAYQMLRLEFAQYEDQLRDVWRNQFSEEDERELQETFAGNYFNFLRYKDDLHSERMVKHFSNLKVFLQCWEMDPTVAYNALEFIGAGRPWQPTLFQESLMDAWFATIEELDAGPLKAMALERLGEWFVASGFHFLARAFLQRLLAVHQACVPPDDEAQATALTLLARSHIDEQDWAAAKTPLLQAVEHWALAGQAAARPVLPTLALLVQVLFLEEDYEKAIVMQEKAVAIHMADRPDPDPQVCHMMMYLAVMDARLGRLDEARALAQSTLVERRQLLGPTHPEVAESLGVLSGIAAQEGNIAAAERYLWEAVELLRVTMTGRDPYLATYLRRLATMVEERGERQEAETLYMEARHHFEDAPQQYRSLQVTVLHALIKLQAARGDPEAAQSTLGELIFVCDETFKTVPPGDLLAAADARATVAALFAECGEAAEAADNYEKAAALLQRIPPTEYSAALLAMVRQALGRPGPSFAPVGAGYAMVVQSPGPITAERRLALARAQSAGMGNYRADAATVKF